MCWRLRKCLYGTRDAPAQWEALYTRRLSEMGFKCGLASRCCFFHPGRQVRCVVHGDDFTFSGSEHELKWVEEQMKRAFVCKVEGIMGPGPHDLKEARVLGRAIGYEGYFNSLRGGSRAQGRPSCPRLG